MTSAPPTESSPTLDAYSARHGLFCRSAAAGLPKATQLMRHGFLQEVPSMARGDLPGGVGEGWLAQAIYVYEGRTGLVRDPFTLVLLPAAASSAYAVRVLCHDRSLGERERSNPDADRPVIELDDRKVHLESDRFLARYEVSTDHDQDQLKVWQIFSPGLIEWLTGSAPAGFSFELQDGALCCFVPGLVSGEAELDALCEGAARVHARIAEIEGGAGAAPGGEPTRADAVDRELAEHPFASPPESVKAAAKKFRHGLLLGDRAWALGAEAFFREQARAAGYEPIATAAYRAGHLDTALPGVLAHAAEGRTKAGDLVHLVLTDSDDYGDMGWTNLVVDTSSPMAAFAIAGDAPRVDTSKRGEMQVGCDGRSLILTTLDGGRQGRDAGELEAFLARARELTEGLAIQGGGARPGGAVGG